MQYYNQKNFPKHNNKLPYLGAVPLTKDLTRFTYIGTDQPLSVVVYGDKEKMNIFPLQYDPNSGIHTADLPIRAGTHYYLKKGEQVFSDPISRFQPKGVENPSSVVDLSFDFAKSPAKSESPPTIYELHVGTFGRTFLGTINKLSYLKALGVDTLQIMPIQQCVGKVNWGYDPTHSYAPYNVYGAPKDLQRLVHAAHKLGFKVIVDVVYNHRGPEADELPKLIDNLEDKGSSSWGNALNFSTKAVREYFIQNACYLVDKFNFDGIRIDAAHAMKNRSTPHILTELSERVRRVKPDAIVIAEFESDKDPRAWSKKVKGSFKFDFKYHDSLGIAIRSILAGNHKNLDYYEKPARRTTKELVRHLRTSKPNSWNTWEHHDWRGNEAPYLSVDQMISLSASRTGASILAFLKGSYTIFQGQEYGGEPFYYFRDALTSFSKKAIEDGRAKEFEKQLKNSKITPPSPFDDKTFFDSRHHAEKIAKGRGARQYGFYKNLIALRKRREFHSDYTVTIKAVGEGLIILTRKPKKGINGKPLIMIASIQRGAKSVDLSSLLPSAKNAKWIVQHSTALERKKMPPMKVAGGVVNFRGVGALVLSPK